MIDVKQDQMSRTFDASAHMLDVQSLTSSSETDSRCDFLGEKIRPSVVRTTAATTVYTVFFSVVNVMRCTMKVKCAQGINKIFILMFRKPFSLSPRALLYPPKVAK